MGAEASGTRRLLLWAQTDIWGMGEVSESRRLAAWIGLAITTLIALLLVTGY